MVARLFIVAAVILTAIACQAPSETERPSAALSASMPKCDTGSSTDALCIVVLGDSLAVGEPLLGGDRWWELLQRRIRDGSARSIEVDNWGVSGSRVDLLESIANGQPALESYQIAIVIEGVNDVGVVDHDQWQRRYLAAIEAIERRGLRVIVATPPPYLADGDFTDLFDLTTGAIRALATADRPVLDIDGAWRSLGVPAAARYYVDFVHQDVAGQAAMAELAYTALKPLIAGAR